jgi:hypothetical protein
VLVLSANLLQDAAVTHAALFCGSERISYALLIAAIFSVAEADKACDSIAEGICIVRATQSQREYASRSASEQRTLFLAGGVFVGMHAIKVSQKEDKRCQREQKNEEIAGEVTI